MIKKASLLIIISLSYCSSNAPTFGSSTLAIVNDRSILQGQFAEQAHSIANTPGIDLTSKDGRINVLKDMINEELVFQEALKENFHLKNLGIKHEIVKQYLRQTFEKNLPNITDKQTKEFYDKHQKQVDVIRASHILISTQNKDDASSKLEAKNTAEKVRAEILQGKISFTDAAAKYSSDATKSAGGDLGYFDYGRMVENFSKAAFSLKKPGDISSVVESEFGYHLILLTADQRGYEQNKEKIRWKLYQDSMQPMVDAFFKKLRENANIKMSDKDIMAIQVPN